MHRRNFLKYSGTSALATLATASAASAAREAGRMGPLRPHRLNPRYFADGSGTAILLTGAHTWNNLVDMGPSDPPEPFDFAGYLKFLQRYGHNFIRLWAWESTTWDTRANGRWGHGLMHVAPHPWPRTGPGRALDGKSKFDLSRFNEDYFARLRSRIQQARDAGIYVSVMLFEGWALTHGNLRRSAEPGWAWRSHPFHPANNINGVDAGDPDNPLVGRPHRLGQPRVNEIQQAYIRRVVETVADLDNVLFEVINEGGDRAWDWWVVRTVRAWEASKGKRHPIGITGHGAEPLASMLASPADWVSPGSRDGYREDPPAWHQTKVSLLDTDHIWGIGGSLRWVWNAFTRGHNPLFMDPYDGRVLGDPSDPRWERIRKAMGYVRALSLRTDLARLTPHDKLADTGHCLADPGTTYIVYSGDRQTFTVDLSDATGHLTGEWVNGRTGQTVGMVTVRGGARAHFRAPVRSDAVLFLRVKRSGR